MCPKKVLLDVLEDKNKSEMKKKDRRRRGGEESDYSQDGSNWEESFDDELLKEFKRVNGSVVSIMGYDK